MLFKNTHEAIIDAETFETVQGIRKNKRRPNKFGELGMFSGIVKCATCGNKHVHLRDKGIDTNAESYVCGTYHSYKNPCTPHSIRIFVLEEIVLAHMSHVLSFTKEYEDEFVKVVMNDTVLNQEKQLKQKRKTL